MGDSGGETELSSIGALFVGFLGPGLIWFGGVLPLARGILVEQRRCMTAAAFAVALSLRQVLPGGKFVNLSVAVGRSSRGLPARWPDRPGWGSFSRLADAP